MKQTGTHLDHAFRLLIIGSAVCVHCGALLDWTAEDIDECAIVDVKFQPTAFCTVCACGDRAEHCAPCAYACGYAHELEQDKATTQ